MPLCVCEQSSKEVQPASWGKPEQSPACTQGASEPSAAPRLIPHQTFLAAMDQPRIDRSDDIVLGGVKELEDSFTVVGCIMAV